MNLKEIKKEKTALLEEKSEMEEGEWIVYKEGFRDALCLVVMVVIVFILMMLIWW